MDLQHLLETVQDCQADQERSGEVGTEVGNSYVSAVLAFTEVFMKDVIIATLSKPLFRLVPVIPLKLMVS
jgi:hypothetical protein